jgi:hypothetical protein
LNIVVGGFSQAELSFKLYASYSVFDQQELGLIIDVCFD